MKDNTARRQQGALFFSALSVPSILLLPSLHPAAVVGFAVPAMLLWRVAPDGAGLRARRGIGTAALEAGALALSVCCLGVSVRLGAMAYPSASDPRSFGVLLLALAAYTVRNGLQPLLRAAAICFFFHVAIDAAVIAFGIEGISVVYPADCAGAMENYLCLPWMLLPLAAFWMDAPVRGGKALRGWHWAWAAVLIVPSLVCWLNLSPAVAAEDPFPFYTLAKSISVFGVMERFEVLLSASLTTGIFCLMGIFAHICGNILKRWLPKLRHRAVGTVIFFAGALAGAVNMALLRSAVALLAPIFWGVVPLAAQRIGALKKP